jgi:biotin synthase
MRGLIDTLFEGNNLTNEELKALIECEDNSIQEEYLFKQADKKRRQTYGNEIYIRGLIEISNYCKNNCLYCGIRCGNLNIERYRLSEKNILDCVSYGYSLGFRTFVMQGGEDLHFSDKDVCQIVSKIKKSYPDCAVTLSIGEKDKQTYQDFFNAGADRYLLRHETAIEDKR